MPNRPYLDASVQWRINSGQLSLEEPDYRSVVEAILAAGLATEVVGLISAGKEANVYLARYNGAPLAIKSYRLYRTSHRGGGPVKQDSMGWRAAHEYEMMRQAWKGGVKVPTPARRVENRFSMRYLGTENGPAPRLKDVVLEEPGEFLDQVLDTVRRLIGAGVVHGDLSAFNILVHEGDPWVIDFSEAIRVDRAGASPWIRLTEARAVLETGLAALQMYFRKYDLQIDVAAYANELVEAGDRHRDPARHERLAHEPRAFLEARLDRGRVLDHEVRGEFAQRGGVRRIVLVPEVPREGPVLHGREVRDDVPASRREEPERRLRDDAGVHDDRDRRLGREAHLLPVLLDRGARRDDAVVTRGGRHAHEWHTRVEGRALRDVDRTTAADSEGEIDVPFSDPLFSLSDFFHCGVRDQELRGPDLPCREILLDDQAGDLHRRLVRDDQGALPELQRLTDLADRVQGIMADDDVSGKLHRLRLREGLRVHRRQCVSPKLRPRGILYLKATTSFAFALIREGHLRTFKTAPALSSAGWSFP